MSDILASHNYWHWALYFIEKVNIIMNFQVLAQRMFVELIFMICFPLGDLTPGVDYIGRLICVCICAALAITLAYLSSLKLFKFLSLTVFSTSSSSAGTVRSRSANIRFRGWFQFRVRISPLTVCLLEYTLYRVMHVQYRHTGDTY